MRHGYRSQEDEDHSYPWKMAYFKLFKLINKLPDLILILSHFIVPGLPLTLYLCPRRNCLAKFLNCIKCQVKQMNHYLILPIPVIILRVIKRN